MALPSRREHARATCPLTVAAGLATLFSLNGTYVPERHLCPCPDAGDAALAPWADRGLDLRACRASPPGPAWRGAPSTSTSPGRGVRSERRPCTPSPWRPRAWGQGRGWEGGWRQRPLPQGSLLPRASSSCPRMRGGGCASLRPSLSPSCPCRAGRGAGWSSWALTTLGRLQLLAREALWELLGREGELCWWWARGIDPRPFPWTPQGPVEVGVERELPWPELSPEGLAAPRAQAGP
jgi:hypothetical protein